MAKHPSSNEKVQFIWDFWADPCDAPFSVYLKCLWPVWLKLVITWYAFDPLQFFTGFVSPFGGKKTKRGSPHGQGKQGKGGKRTWKKAWKGWTGFDPSDWLGRKAQQPFGLNGRPVPAGVGTLWNVYGLQQRVVNYLFIYSLIEEGLYEWSLALAATEYCQAVQMPIATGYQPADVISGILEFWPLTFPFEQKARNGAFVRGNGGRTGKPFSNAVFTGDLFIDDPSMGPFVVKLRSSDGQEVNSGEIPYPGGSWSLSLSSTGDVQYFCGASGSGFARTENQYLTVWSRMPEPPPPNWVKIIQEANGLTGSNLYPF